MLTSLVERVTKMVGADPDAGAALRSRVVHAGFWAFSLRGFLKILSTVRLIFLGRLLAPNDFGLFGIALMALLFVETFSKTGFKSALIHQQDDISGRLNAAWTLEVLRGLVIGGIIVAAAPAVAWFFDEPRATLLLRVMAFSVMLRAASNVAIVYMEKELQFRRRFLFQASITLTEVIVSIAVALATRDAWALIAGLVAGSLVHFVMSFLVHPFRPRLSFDTKVWGELFGFGRWIMASNMAVYGILNIDQFIIGRVLGASSLGLYRMAYLLSQLAATEITHVLTQVAFPTYSLMQNDPAALREWFIRALSFISLITVPLVVLQVVLAPELIPLILGGGWDAAIVPFQILLAWGLLRAFSGAAWPLFLATGRPDIPTKVQFLKLAILAITVYPAARWWGLDGVAFAVLLSAVIGEPLAFLIAVYRIGVTNRMLLSALAVPAAGAAAMGAAALGVRYATSGAADFGVVLAVGFSGTIAYALIVVMLMRGKRIGRTLAS